MWYKNIAGRFFGLVTKPACDRQTDRGTDGRTDGRTDGQNYDFQAASRGKNLRGCVLHHTQIDSNYFFP